MYFLSTLRILHLAMLTSSCILIKKFPVLERLILTSELKKIIFTYRNLNFLFYLKFAAKRNG